MNFWALLGGVIGVSLDPAGPIVGFLVAIAVRGAPYVARWLTATLTVGLVSIGGSMLLNHGQVSPIFIPSAVISAILWGALIAALIRKKPVTSGPT